MFVHMDGCIDRIKDNDKVTFEIGKGPKGPVAKSVKLVKATVPKVEPEADTDPTAKVETESKVEPVPENESTAESKES